MTVGHVLADIERAMWCQFLDDDRIVTKADIQVMLVAAQQEANEIEQELDSDD